MTLFKVVIRDRQQAEEDERIDDVQHAEIACVAAAEMGNRGRHQRDREAGVREFLDLEWNGGDQERSATIHRQRGLLSSASRRLTVSSMDRRAL